MTSRTFNLVTNPWICLQRGPRLSLLEFFSSEEDLRLGGTPTEKFVVFRLLLSILQAATTLKVPKDRKNLSLDEMKRAARDYLLASKQRFDLYDPDHPFLQHKGVCSVKKSIPLASLVFGVCTGNATLLNEGNQAKALTDPEKVYVLLQQIIFALGGKKPDEAIRLDPNCVKKKSSPFSPTVGRGWLHSIPLGKTIFETLKLNLITDAELHSHFKFLTSGKGVPLWEVMPVSETCAEAKAYRNSLMGRLIPLSRFCRIDERDQLHFTFGIAYPDIQEMNPDPSVSLRFVGKGSPPKATAVRAQTERMPWRQFDAFLAFAGENSKLGCKMLSMRQRERFPGVWCVGLQLSEQAGEQYFSGTDDYVESVFELELPDDWKADELCNKYRGGMEKVEKISKILYASVMGYYTALKDDGKRKAEMAARIFWGMADRDGEKFVHACAKGQAEVMIKGFSDYAVAAYDRVCSKTGGRYLMAWAQNRPRLGAFKNKGGNQNA